MRISPCLSKVSCQALSSHIFDLLTRNSELKQAEEKKASYKIADEKLVADYYDYRQQLDQLGADFREVITHPTYSLPFIQPGRLVKIKYEKLDFGWGIVINYQKRLPPKVRALQVTRT